MNNNQQQIAAQAAMRIMQGVSWNKQPCGNRQSWKSGASLSAVT